MERHWTAPPRRTPPPDVNFQNHRDAPRRRTPPPDVVRSSQVSSPDIVHPTQASPPSARPSPLPPAQVSEFLIIGLFALRLTKRLVESLENYAGRDADINWLTNFLAPYPPEYALAKISESRKDDYVVKYQEVVSRMKKQPRYPLRFMQMNPDQSMRQQQGDRDVEREMTDRERLDIIDFCDAAGEWGSILPIPAREANRMIELADRRRIADLDEWRGMCDSRQGHEDRRR